MVREGSPFWLEHSLVRAVRLSAALANPFGRVLLATEDAKERRERPSIHYLCGTLCPLWLIKIRSRLPVRILAEIGLAKTTSAESFCILAPAWHGKTVFP